MKAITTIEDLEDHYGTPLATAKRKVAQRMTPDYRRWIAASRFCVLATVGRDGTDASPRGDDGAVVTELDERTLALPDWRGNDRIDSLRNVVADGRLSLMFMVPGSDNVIRVNGRGQVTADPKMLARFERKGLLPRTVIVIAIDEIYFQCSRALMRSNLWDDTGRADDLPSAGQILAAMTEGTVGGDAYDREWPKRAARTMW